MSPGALKVCLVSFRTGGKGWFRATKAQSTYPLPQLPRPVSDRGEQALLRPPKMES